MLPHIVFPDKGPIRGLEQMVAKQRLEGGRLVIYRRVYTFFTITWTSEKMHHIPVGGSRLLPGLVHSLLTLLLGIWGPTGVITVLMVWSVNFRGGIDVTAHLAAGPIDPFWALPADSEQAKRDVIASQWSFVALAIFVILLVIVIFGLPSP